LFEELAALKIKGADAVTDITADAQLQQDIEAMPEKEKLAAGAVLATHWSKIASPPAATSCCLAAYNADEQRKMDNRAQAASKAAEAKAAEAKAAEAKAAEAKAMEDSAVEATPVLPAEAAPPQPSMEGVLVEGDTVRTKARKHKDKYHDKKGTVEKILAKKVRVLLLEGPAKGTTHDFTFDNVVMIGPPAEEGPHVAASADGPAAAPAAAAPAAAPAATPAAAPDDGNPADLAAALFGDPDLADS
jgi:colicin import membrane protein